MPLLSFLVLVFAVYAAAAAASMAHVGTLEPVWNVTFPGCTPVCLRSNLHVGGPGQLLVASERAWYIDSTAVLDAATGETVGQCAGYAAAATDTHAAFMVRTGTTEWSSEVVAVYTFGAGGALVPAFNVTTSSTGHDRTLVALSATVLVVGLPDAVFDGAVLVYSLATGNLLWSLNKWSNMTAVGAAVAANSRYVAVSTSVVNLYDVVGTVVVMDAFTGDYLWQASGQAMNDGFGGALDMTENLLAVGAQYAPLLMPSRRFGPGTVYVYRQQQQHRNQQQQQQYYNPQSSSPLFELYATLVGENNSDMF